MAFRWEWIWFGGAIALLALCGVLFRTYSSIRSKPGDYDFTTERGAGPYDQSASLNRRADSYKRMLDTPFEDPKRR